jgi:RimJ/RimL family protein N-acetyltransferase
VGTRGEAERRDRRGTLVLDDGTAVRFRAVSPGDARALQRLHARCGDRSIELRFFGPLGRLPDEKAARLARAEDRDRLALAAIDPEQPDEILAVVRFEREEGGETAEYAALVEDRWQGRGLGRALTERLVGAAHGRDVRCLYALVTPGNERMVRLLRGLGLPTRRSREGDAERLEVDLRGSEEVDGSADDRLSR